MPLTYVVLSLVPFTWTTDVETNPVPFTVSVTDSAPAGTLVGLMDVITGVGGGVPPPPDPDEPLPPQFVKVSETAMPTQKATTREHCMWNPVIFKSHLRLSGGTGICRN
jgi:hypothetical protein